MQWPPVSRPPLDLGVQIITMSTDQARKLKKRQMEELERDVGRKKHVDNHMLSILRDNYTEPLNSHLG